MNVEGRPVLADEAGAFGNPSSDSLRTSITLATRGALVVAYAPAACSVDRLSAVVDRTAETLLRHCGGTRTGSRVL